MKQLLAFSFLLINLTACTQSMKKELTIQETEKFITASIPSTAKEFMASSESGMNLFIYARFILSSGDFSKFITDNRLIQNDSFSDNFSVYNKSSNWWKFSEEMKNPGYYTKEGTKGKWKTNLAIASNDTGNGDKLIYVLYYEEP